MDKDLQQSKGNFSFVYGAYIGKNFAESSINYEIGDFGDVKSTIDAVVHLRKNKNAVVSTVTITVLKKAEGLSVLLGLIASDVPYPMVINDMGAGAKLVFESASATQISMSDTSGALEEETISVQFKGNLKLLEL